MNKLSLFAVLSVSLLSGCAYNYTPPKESVINSTAYVETSVDDTWGNVIEWYAMHNASIDKLDKDSGLITSHWVQLDSRALDCGKVRGNIHTKMINRKARFNTVVKSKGDQTKVSFNVFGEAETYHNFMNNIELQVVRCESTGNLEEAFFDALAENE